jgi:hypothetical protein
MDLSRSRRSVPLKIALCIRKGSTADIRNAAKKHGFFDHRVGGGATSARMVHTERLEAGTRISDLTSSRTVVYCNCVPIVASLA